MIYIAGLILFIVVVFGPQFWTRHIFTRYSEDIESMPGTGGELAEHLLEKLGITGVTVEVTDENNDHYDPENRSVRLSPSVYVGKSLTAITIAAHECGHAIQHDTSYPPLLLRSKCARYMPAIERIAAILLVATPFLSLITRSPVIGVIMVFSGITILFLPVIFHIITLPVEFDASFGRAMPVLVHGKYIPDSAIPISRKILTAAALTYVSASLASLLNFYRWMVFLRR